MRFSIAIALSLLLCSCSRNENVIEPLADNDDAAIPFPYQTAHFRFYYTSYDSSSIMAIGDTLERNFRRIVADLDSDSHSLIPSATLSSTMSGICWQSTSSWSSAGKSIMS